MESFFEYYNVMIMIRAFSSGFIGSDHDQNLLSRNTRTKIEPFSLNNNILNIKSIMLRIINNLLQLFKTLNHLNKV